MPRSPRLRSWLSLIGDGALLPITSLTLPFSPQHRRLRRLFWEQAKPSTGAIALYTATGLVLGLIAWIIIGFILLTFARGALYPIFDHGPYDNSWGGPTRGGAWAVHFLLSTPMQLVGLLFVSGVAALNRRLTAPVRGGRTGWWPWPLAVLACAATAFFIYSWLGQV